MFSDELNPQQLEAAYHSEGPLMIVAGAGSGKTRVITYRIAHMIREKNISPDNILAITFTNKAAREMRDRVRNMLGQSANSPLVSTFHSFCLRILRQYIDGIGYSKDFAVYDAQDQLTLVKQCMKTANVDSDAFPPKTILGAISGFKSDFLLPSDIDMDSLSYGNKMKAAEVYQLYQDALKKNNALDFDDLLLLMVTLLRDSLPAASYCKNKFRYIMVDEFQDTNKVQYRLVQLLAGETNNVCVVGDDDQSIYRWRGANIENILNFEKDFPGSNLIKLEQNYRSTQNILNAAGAIVKENAQRKDKTLWTENTTGELVTYYRADDEVDEARVVCGRILQYDREESISFNDMAILYRTNAQSRVIEDQLRQQNIPYQVIGGLRFYERKEIKDVLAYLKVLVNPSDSVSLKRIINVPTRGIGKTTVDKIESYCARENITLLEGLHAAVEQGLVGSGPRVKVDSFVNLLKDLDRFYQSGSPVDLIKEVMERTGYLSKLQMDLSIENRSRVENLNELYSAVEEFTNSRPEDTLKDFLDSATLVADVDSLDESRGVLPLMTLHTCKGLEFDVVSIVGMENGLLPHASSMSDPEQYEEERRLCYVGFTRARKRLMVTNARRRRIYGNSFNYQPSDFLSSIPGELLNKEMTPMSSESFRRDSYSSNKVDSGIPPSEVKPTGIDGDFAVGAKVLHPKFGSGVVINKEGSDDDLKVVVFFKKAGKKKLAVNLAKLIPL
jgi:DNA helicase-2/ATP-dependent DNA helicase PcrA